MHAVVKTTHRAPKIGVEGETSIITAGEDLDLDHYNEDFGQWACFLDDGTHVWIDDDDIVGGPKPCRECGDVVNLNEDFRAGHGMCGSCLHNALRSGWVPGE